MSTKTKCSKALLETILKHNERGLEALKWVYLRTTDSPVIFKTGRTGQDDPYIRATVENSTCLCARLTHNDIKCEAAVKAAFKERYMLAYGSEFFIGPFDDMAVVFNSVVNDYNKKYDTASQELYATFVANTNNIEDPPGFDVVECAIKYRISNEELSTDKKRSRHKKYKKTLDEEVSVDITKTDETPKIEKTVDIPNTPTTVDANKAIETKAVNATTTIDVTKTVEFIKTVEVTKGVQPILGPPAIVSAGSRYNKCDKCDKVFGSIYSLDRHMRHSCPFNGHRTRRPDSLLRRTTTTRTYIRHKLL